MTVKTRSTSKIPAFLRNSSLRLLLFGGKGGTGKTTCAAAAGLYIAGRSASEKILLVSTDPAHSLLDSIDGLHPPSNLEIIEFDAAKYLEEFRRKNGPKLLEIANRGTLLDKEDISRFLDLSMPGLDELFGFFEISRWVEQGEYGLIIVDTAPTGHTLRLLEMPRFFNKWVGALDTLLAKHRYMKEVFRGIYQPDELDEFVMDLGHSAKRMEKLLRNRSSCRFVPVALAEPVVISETVRLIDELEKFRIAADEVIVNRIYPQTDCPLCSAGRARQFKVLERLPPEFSKRKLWTLPLFPEEVRGEKLLEVWTGGSALDQIKDDAAAKPEIRSTPSPRLVENPAPLPGPSLRMLLFAGKGGVGKTTLSCATAIRLAREYPDQKLLLFSVDPAHSVSGALDIKVGPSPTPVFQGLFAMEIDAQAEFEALKKSYRQELREFLDSVMGNFDLTFDREVMEKILDLSPPGLDEIMALVRVIDFIKTGEFDLLVLDTAPTGHLIRLLELPEILDQWIKAFFELFLKYKNIFRLPKMADKLVEMSKALKLLRSVLKDGAQSSLFAVAIPTRMAFEETSDLLAACGRIGIDAPVLFVNMVTPPNDCPFCARLRESESKVIDDMARRFAEKIRTIVFRQPELQGLNLLAELGNSLYTAGKAADS